MGWFCPAEELLPALEPFAANKGEEDEARSDICELEGLFRAEGPFELWGLSVLVEGLSEVEGPPAGWCKDPLGR